MKATSHIGNEPPPPLSAIKLVTWLVLQLGSMIYAVQFIKHKWGPDIRTFFGVDTTPTDFCSRWYDMAINLGIVISLLSPLFVGVYGWLIIVNREPTYNALASRKHQDHKVP